jgi:glycine hydroxymethyltransferase
MVTTTTHKTLRGPRGGLIVAKENPEVTKKLNSGIFPGSQGGPLMHVIAAKALAFKLALAPEFKQYCQAVISNAQHMAKILITRGYHILTNGTDNHMLVISLINKNINGKDASDLLCQANITVNHNSIPNDPLPPRLTSGIRIGTPAMTTRGFSLNEAQLVANWIADILDNPDNQNNLQQIKQQVIDLCKKFPVY